MVRIKGSQWKWANHSISEEPEDIVLVVPTEEEINQLHGFDRVLAIADKRDVKDTDIVYILPKEEGKKEEELTNAINIVENFRDRYKEWAEKNDDDVNIKAINRLIEKAKESK